ncbi:ribosome-associated ATPase/putative transporter RbbA [Lacibacterium aquatile]|uniref:Ribosome-associated ATPase/putative transporter RbbA n=1 Tax=Lacibacterium aquatile TaxID=1168082 RepID=A0ABW5DP91_9PROT
MTAALAFSLEAIDVRHSYGKSLALDGVSVGLRAGEAAALVGPDGVGKSTLLALIAGAKLLQDGRVLMLGADMANRRARSAVQPRVAYMPQGLGRNLYPNLSVRENIEFFARLFGLTKADAEARIAELLSATALVPFADRLMRRLSGGMKQKLGLCCALIHDPDFLLLDEPTTGVDPLSRKQFWELVDRIRQARPGLSLLVATSDMDEARRFGRIIFMAEGKILTDGSPIDLLQRTGRDNLEAAFIELLPADRRGDGGTTGILPLNEDLPIAIESHNLSRRFGDFVAVDRVSLSIRQGEIFGFLGSNGCGKSTTMKMLTGLLPPSEGNAWLFGEPVDSADLRQRRRIGYMSQSFSLYGEMTVQQNLDLHAGLYGLRDKEKEQRIEALAQEFDLGRYLSSRSGDLPLGLRQRLSLAVAVLHEPDILILDEPTSGVDPVARNGFWAQLRRLSREKGITIFISTHFMAEAERCDRISFMHAGRVLATGTPDELKAARQATSLDDAFISYMEQQETPAVIGLSGSKIKSAPKASLFSLARCLSYSRREAIELLRDRIRLAFALGGTALLMLIFGFGITLDVDHLRFSVLDRDGTPESRAYIDAFGHSSYFVRRGDVDGPEDLQRRLQANDITLGLEIPPQFGANSRVGRPTEVLVVVDGAMPFRAQTVQGYVAGVHQQALAEAGRGEMTSGFVEPRYRYNQSFQSAEAMVPSTIAMMLVFIPAILTALGVVSEKELGSITNLYVTPVSKLEYLLGKQIPYIGLGFLNFALMTLMAVTIFGLRFKGSFLGLGLAAFAYVLATTALGLVASTMTRTQVAAIFATAMATMMPATQFSGLMQPVSTLEGAGYWIGTFFPTTYFIKASVGAFTKGLGFFDLLPFVLQTLAFWPVLLLVAALLLPKQEA